MIQKTEARSTDRNVIVGSVGSSSKLTTFRTRSGMLENSSELKSYCGSSIEAVCSLVTLLSFSSASLSVTLEMAGVFSSAGAAILLTKHEESGHNRAPQVLPLLKIDSRAMERQLRTSYTGVESIYQVIAAVFLRNGPCLSFDRRCWRTHSAIPFLIRQHAIVDQNEIYAGHAIVGMLVSWFAHLIEG